MESGPGSSVGIAIDYGLDGLGSNQVVDKEKNCADASNGPAPHSRQLVSTASFPILATTAT